MHDTTEEALVQLLQDVEGKRRKTQQDIEVLQAVVLEKDREHEALQIALQLYRAKNDIPHEPIPTVCTETVYSGLGPAALIEQWASLHAGVVIIKDIADEAVRSQSYGDRQQAYRNLTTTIKRKRHFQRVAPGKYQRVTVVGP